ncbi:MAG: hypothetical protein M0P71_06775 [Melioribacteraceae bacterium]|nr:hypothetical protein [Melioribacteraceae bacterium]
MSDFFDKIIGQKKSKLVLTKLINSRRVPHAFIFSGSKGIGKFFTAIEFAKQINQNDRGTQSQIKSLSEPFIKYVFALPRGKSESGDDGPFDKLTKSSIETIQSEIKEKINNPYHFLKIEDANTIKISSIRDIIRFLTIYYPPEIKRFVIIDDAHLLNEESQNSLLKSLEEPPENVFFILMTDKIESLLKTIQSRSFVINFENLIEEELEEVLKNYFKIDSSLASKVSKFSAGSVYKAAKLLEMDFESLSEKAIDFARFSVMKKYSSALAIINEINDKYDITGIKLFIDLVNMWFLDTIKEKHSELKDFYYIGKEESIYKFNKRFPGTKQGDIIENLNKYSNYFDRNLNLNIISLSLIFEIVAIELGE